MQPFSILGQIILLGFLLPAVMPGWAEPLPPGSSQTGPIRLQPRQPPRLVILAQHLMSADENQRWEFAVITLDVLRETYLMEMSAAAHEKTSTPARRAKIARWRRATADLAEQLRRAGVRLAEGAVFRVHVDPLQQILIMVDGQTFSVSGPNPGAEKAIEDRIIGEFCAYNDCSYLRTGPEPAAAPELAIGGVWNLQELRRPAYEVGDILRCEFSNLSERNLKARACSEAAMELRQLDDALQQGEALGYRVDWDRLAMSPPANTTTTRLVITAEGGYLQVHLPRLARLTGADWRHLMQGLRQAGIDGHRLLVVRQADRLVAVSGTD